MHEDWERDDLILNLVNTLQPAARHIQERMVWHFTQCDADYGRRVAEGLGLSVPAPGSLIPTTNDDAAQPHANGTNGQGAPLGANAADVNAAAARAETAGHEAKPYYSISI